MPRLDEARKVAGELLDTLELSQSPIEVSLMKAKRLARLMRDGDAQIWLDLETRGYPDNNFNFTQIGTCQKYAVAGGRITSEGRYYTSSLPELEAERQADEAHIIDVLRSAHPPDAKAKDFTEMRATTALISAQVELQAMQKKSFAQSQGLFASLKSALHSYATDIYLAIELGDVAQDIFEEAREDVDSFVRAHCPKAVEQLIAINERLREDLAESRSAALTSCRRLLVSVADSLFPAQSEPWQDSKGKLRKVGTEEYKNRLIAYMENRLSSAGSFSILATEIEHLAARLDAVYEKASKGVHTDVSRDEARLAVIQTYLFIGEIARLSKGNQNSSVG